MSINDLRISIHHCCMECEISVCRLVPDRHSGAEMDKTAIRAIMITFLLSQLS